MTELQEIQASIAASRDGAAHLDPRKQAHHLHEAMLAALALDDSMRVRFPATKAAKPFAADGLDGMLAKLNHLRTAVETFEHLFAKADVEPFDAPDDDAVRMLVEVADAVDDFVAYLQELDAFLVQS